jgi:hypothetical protein
MRRRGWMCCSRTGEIVACGGREDVDGTCCGSVQVGFGGIWDADGGVCEIELGEIEVSDLVTGREGGAV